MTILCSFPLHAADSLPFKTGEKIAFLGDSITQHGAEHPSGYVNLVMDGLAAAGIRAVCIPAGVASDGARKMTARLEKDVISKKPDWMFFSCGVNDCSNGMDNPGIPIEEYKEKVVAIWDRCKKAGIRVIVLTATPVVEEPEHVANTNLIPYNEFLRTAAAERKLPLVDLNMVAQACIDAKKDKSKRIYTVDGTHMSPHGNIVLAAAILRGLGMEKTLLKTCIERWKTQSGL